MTAKKKKWRRLSTKPIWERVTIELSPQAVEMIDKLLATGLYGVSRAELCERFVLDKLRGFLEAPPRLEPIGPITPRPARDEIEGEAVAMTDHDKYDYCSASWMGNDSLACTRPVHKDGDHVVGGCDGLVVARWPVRS